ncbi:Thymidylate synthase [Geodia barretti]|nr:Thymidylate synthase [Geodia barretti]
MNVPKLAKQTLIEFVLQRSPRPFPRLELRRQVSDIDKFVYDDIILHDYHPHPKIHMDMAV